MSLKIRLARGGAKKRPYYRIVVADSHSPRDGRFLEKVGTYNPVLPKDLGNRVVLNTERVAYWLSQGAVPTDRVARFLDTAGLRARPARVNPNKGKPGAKALERIAAAAAAVEAAAAAEVAAAEAAAAAKVAAAEAAAAAAAAPAEAEAAAEGSAE